MGSRASQLRNRQQVQDSSATVAANAAVASMPAGAESNHAGGGQLKSMSQDHSNNNNNNNNVNSINNNDGDNFAGEDVAKLKEALRSASSQLLQEDGDTAQSQQPNGNSSSQPSKFSTLQRQATHIQSLAQRIRRSSSLRTQKLKGLIPSFGKRKVSFKLGPTLFTRNASS